MLRPRGNNAPLVSGRLGGRPRASQTSRRHGGQASKVVPISVFVSRQLGRLFVRRSFTPLFDVPIEIRDLAEPIGTHVFSVMESQNEAQQFGGLSCRSRRSLL